MCTSFAWIESSRRVLWLNSNIKLLEELWSSASLSQGNCILLPITKCHLKHSPKLWRLTDYTDSFTSGQAESTADGSIYQIPKWKEKWLLDKLECLLSQGQVGKGNVIRYSQRAEKARRKSVTFLLPFPRDGTGTLCSLPDWQRRLIPPQRARTLPGRPHSPLYDQCCWGQFPLLKRVIRLRSYS